jgi:hypothetical protein
MVPRGGASQRGRVGAQPRKTKCDSDIPFALEGQPEKIEAAQKALAARDVLLLESILKPLPKPVGR